MEFLEAHVERLLGKRVHDPNGECLGRLEEMRVEIVDGEYVVTEFHVGPGALLERIAGFATQLPFLRRLPYTRRGYRLRWEDFDLSDPRSPRARISRDSLRQHEL